MTTKSKRYYPEIDGLRVIAVIAVILNHIHESLILSGFLGVDVFFVISGFVVTSSLLKRTELSVKKFLVSFYSRRIKRLMPALIFCIATSYTFSLLFVYEAQLALKTGIYSLFDKP